MGGGGESELKQEYNEGNVVDPEDPYVFGPPGSGSDIICTDPDVDPDLDPSINEQTK